MSKDKKKKENAVIEINDGSTTLKVTEKAFRVVYQERGFKQGAVEVEAPEGIEADELTVAEIKSLLDEQGIDYDAKAKKDELLKLLDGE